MRKYIKKWTRNWTQKNVNGVVARSLGIYGWVQIPLSLFFKGLRKFNDYPQTLLFWAFVRISILI